MYVSRDDLDVSLEVSGKAGAEVALGDACISDGRLAENEDIVRGFVG